MCLSTAYKNEMEEEISMLLGGRIAEALTSKDVSTGASNDIERATAIARAMVTRFGMSEKFGMMGLATVESEYLGGRAALNCGEDTAAEIDKEVLKIISEAYKSACDMLKENKEREERYQATIDRLSTNIETGIEKIQDQLKATVEKLTGILLEKHII